LLHFRKFIQEKIVGLKKRAREKEEKNAKWPAVAGKRTPVAGAET